MKRGFFVLLILFFSPMFTFATHIVGGGFNMVHQGNSNYSIRLTLYFDGINGDTLAVDQVVTFSIFRKRGNFRTQQITVPLDPGTDTIAYEENDCGPNAKIKTKLLTYQTIVSLLPSLYDDAEGYYVMWERCCRNGSIINIVNPGATGQTFVMYFPPVIKNNQPFINSSPKFSPAPNNLFCINLVNNMSFSANDADGDSLVYDLVNPLNSKTASSQAPVVPIGTRGPYPSIGWSLGFDSSNQIPGNPPLSVNGNTGLLNIFPNATGLYVFSVRCSEYRNGLKIGEIRREFQQLVVDCPPNTPPGVFIQDLNKPGNIAKNDTLYLRGDAINPNCVQVKITDLQIGQTIKLKAIPLNFIPVGPILGDTIKKVSNDSDTVRLSFCLSTCQGSSRQNPLKIRVIAYDNGCSASLSDTLELYLVVTIPPFQNAGLKFHRMIQ